MGKGWSTERMLEFNSSVLLMSQRKGGISPRGLELSIHIMITHYMVEHSDPKPGDGNATRVTPRCGARMYGSQEEGNTFFRSRKFSKHHLDLNRRYCLKEITCKRWYYPLYFTCLSAHILFITHKQTHTHTGWCTSTAYKPIHRLWLFLIL